MGAAVHLRTSENSVLALTSKELKLKDYFTAPEGGSATPLVFTYKERQMIASAGNDGRVYLLDSQSLGGSDHKTPLASSAPLLSEKRAIIGLSSWEDTSGGRFIAATISGPVLNQNRPEVGCGIEDGVLAIIEPRAQDLCQFAAGMSFRIQHHSAQPFRHAVGPPLFPPPCSAESTDDTCWHATATSVAPFRPPSRQYPHYVPLLMRGRYSPDLADEDAVEATIQELFQNARAEYIHIHFAKMGCYAARVDRA